MNGCLRKSLELYNIIQCEKISRDAYEKLVLFFNSWIFSDEFGGYIH